VLPARIHEPRKGEAVAGKVKRPGDQQSRLSLVSKDSTTIAGEPLAYVASPTPEIASAIMTIPPGATTPWMTHPVPTYIYVLEGTLTVAFAEGPPRRFGAGQAFLQARTQWHHGRNDGEGPVRFLAVSIGAREVPGIVHPPPEG
jgi:quercetin dioxygenase-like cupin family protein